mmetsp:Transcript_23415/g.42713  ORF Transcript_23415/g.42713 Transcript_23415/m.42713 type:complete len:446 (-) Transcript_23415:119-1456(-)
MSRLVVRLEAPCGRYRLEMQHASSLADLKNMIASKTSIEAPCQVLSLDAMGFQPVLDEDTATLQECEIRNGTQVWVRLGERPAETHKNTESGAFLGGAAPSSRPVDFAPASRAKAFATPVQDVEHAHASEDDASEKDAAPDYDATRESDNTSEPEVPCNTTDEVDENYHKLLDLHGEQLCSYNLVSGFTGELKCIYQGHLQQTVASFTDRVRAQLVDHHMKDKDVVLIKDGKVLHDDVLMMHVGSTDGSEVQYLIQDEQLCLHARHAASVAQLFEDMNQYMFMVPFHLEDRAFGSAFAEKVVCGLRKGRTISGRARLQRRKGLFCAESQDTWSLETGRVTFVKPKVGGVTFAVERATNFNIAVHGYMSEVQYEHKVCGHIFFRCGKFVQTWKKDEEFVKFLEKMSEQKFAAFMANVFSRQEPWRTGFEYTVLDTIARRDLNRLQG